MKDFVINFILIKYGFLVLWSINIKITLLIGGC
jgi:hypothetical protein